MMLDKSTFNLVAHLRLGVSLGAFGGYALGCLNWKALALTPNATHVLAWFWPEAADPNGLDGDHKRYGRRLPE